MGLSVGDFPLNDEPPDEIRSSKQSPRGRRSALEGRVPFYVVQKVEPVFGIVINNEESKI